MPRVALTEDQSREGEETGGADLKFLFARQQVSIENQRLFFHHAITSVDKFSTIAKDRDDLVKVLKDHWDIDQERSLGDRVQVAAIVCAWKQATSRVEKAAEYDAEFEVQDRAKPLVPSEWTTMRQALERRYGHMDDKLVPAKEYIEKKLAEVEAGEYRSEQLSEVVSKDEVDPDTVVPVWDSKGRMTMRRGSSKVPDPTNAEELRRRLTIMRNALFLISVRHTNRAELQGDYDRVFEDYKSYLLGE